MEICNLIISAAAWVLALITVYVGILGLIHFIGENKNDRSNER